MAKSHFLLSLLFLSVANGEVVQRSLRGPPPASNAVGNSAKPENCLPCNVGYGDVLFKQGYSVERSEYLVCETDPEDDPEGRANMVYSLEDLPKDFHGKFRGQLETGKSRICVPNGKVNRDTHKVEFPKGATPKYLGERRGPKQENGKHRDLMTTTGAHTILVVIITSTFNESDSQVSNSVLANNFFGIGQAPPAATVVSQLQSCSNGKMTAGPATGVNVTNGVINVQISTKISGNITTNLENIMVTATQNALKITDIRNAANHVIFCLPTGSLAAVSGKLVNTWVSYGYTNAAKSFHNAGYCAQLLAPMHEIGHNVGFYHSGNLTANDEYGDRSGIMGNPVRPTPSDRQMCYNAMNNFFSGWFSDRQMTLNLTKGAWIGSLIPPVDYSAAVGTMAGAYSVINVGNLYFQLNSAKKYNNPPMNPNLVNIVVADIPSTTATRSWLLAGLSASQTYTYTNGTGIPLTIKVCNITFGSIDTAYVSVSQNDNVQTPLC